MSPAGPAPATPDGAAAGAGPEPPTPGGRVLAVDLGSRRIGLALSDRSRTLASPWRVLVRSGDAGADLAAIRGAVEECGAEAVVVGLPLSLSGRAGPAARRALDEVVSLRRLLEPLGTTVETADERFTTVTAEAALAASGRRARDRRGDVDRAAAAVLLQAWLDERGHRGGRDHG